jgi:hypothetical protein
LGRYTPISIANIWILFKIKKKTNALWAAEKSKMVQKGQKRDICDNTGI